MTQFMRVRFLDKAQELFGGIENLELVSSAIRISKQYRLHTCYELIHQASSKLWTIVLT
jgi:hypothetical protein